MPGPTLLTTSTRRKIQLFGVGFFFLVVAFTHLRVNNDVSPFVAHQRRRLGLPDKPANSSGGTVLPSGCEAKMAQFYGKQCAEPYCEDLVGGFVNYFKMHTCDLADVPWLSYTILVTWLLVVFWLLADTADSFFVPTLQQIVVLFEVQPALAGITFLSFGNGAPDVFATVASFSAGGNAPDIGIGSLLGSGMFVTTVVLALVAFQSDGRLKRRPFVRDIVCYLATLSWLMYIVYSRQCTLWQAQIFVGLYICFVVFVIGTRKIYLKYYKVHTGSGGGSLDAALLGNDELNVNGDPEAMETGPAVIDGIDGAKQQDDDDDEGELWGWDGGLRLKLRAQKKTSVNNPTTSMGGGRNRRAFQSLTAAEYKKRLDRAGSGSVQRSGRATRLRAASHDANGSDDHHGDHDSHGDHSHGVVDDLTEAVQHSIDHAGGWAEAASKVDHHAHMADDDAASSDDVEPPVGEVVNGLLSEAVQAFVEESAWGKLVFVVCAPLTLARRLSIPVLGNDYFDDPCCDDGGGVNEEEYAHVSGGPEEEEEEEEEEEDGFAWSKPFGMASMVCLPLIFGVGTLPTLKVGPVPVWTLLLLCGVLGAVWLYRGTSHNYPPRSRGTAIVLLVLSFAASILWIYFIANELVTVLQVLGILLGIPNSVLGLTVLAWANSAPDTVSIVGVAKQVRAVVGMLLLGCCCWDAVVGRSVAFCWCFGAVGAVGAVGADQQPTG